MGYTHHHWVSTDLLKMEIPRHFLLSVPVHKVTPVDLGKTNPKYTQLWTVEAKPYRGHRRGAQ
jgi:hypothetical protein